MGASGCLDDPKLKSCAELPTDQHTEACGTACERYCALMVRGCPQEAQGDTVPACESNCLESLRSDGALGDTTGDTIQCRITHALRAKDDPRECAAASHDGGGVCVNQICPEYCQLMQARCPDAYVNEDGCLKTCALFEVGVDDSPGDTALCRLRAARRVTEPTDPACAEASMSGGGVCGTPCEAYCRFVGQSCQGAQSPYESPAECRRICDLMDSGGELTDWQTQADTVQCRTYHASSPAMTSPVTHCPHTTFYNAAVCGQDLCDTFCDLMGRRCPGSFDGQREACRAACAPVVEAGEESTLMPLGAAGGPCLDAAGEPVSL